VKVRDETIYNMQYDGSSDYSENGNPHVAQVDGWNDQAEEGGG
jgi:hypothetical protein